MGMWLVVAGGVLRDNMQLLMGGGLVVLPVVCYTMVIFQFWLVSVLLLMAVALQQCTSLHRLMCPEKHAVVHMLSKCSD